MNASRATAWASAIRSVATFATMGVVAGNVLGSKSVGLLAGALLGMAVNRKRQCPVCMEHHARIQRILESR